MVHLRFREAKPSVATRKGKLYPDDGFHRRRRVAASVSQRGQRFLLSTGCRAIFQHGSEVRRIAEGGARPERSVLRGTNPIISAQLPRKGDRLHEGKLRRHLLDKQGGRRHEGAAVGKEERLLRKPFRRYMANNAATSAARSLVGNQQMDRLVNAAGRCADNPFGLGIRVGQGSLGLRAAKRFSGAAFDVVEHRRAITLEG